jgi:hypothetical protein
MDFVQLLPVDKMSLIVKAPLEKSIEMDVNDGEIRYFLWKFNLFEIGSYGQQHIILIDFNLCSYHIFFIFQPRFPSNTLLK